MLEEGLKGGKEALQKAYVAIVPFLSVDASSPSPCSSHPSRRAKGAAYHEPGFPTYFRCVIFLLIYGLHFGRAPRPQ